VRTLILERKIFIPCTPSLQTPTIAPLPTSAMLRLLLLLPVFRFITGAFDGAIRPIEWPRKSIHQPRVLVDEPFFGSAVQSRLEV